MDGLDQEIEEDIEEMNLDEDKFEKNYNEEMQGMQGIPQGQEQ